MKRNLRYLTFAILEVLTASRKFSASNFGEVVLNHWTLLDPSVPPVTRALTVTLFPSLRSPMIFKLVTFGGASQHRDKIGRKETLDEKNKFIDA